MHRRPALLAALALAGCTSTILPAGDGTLLGTDRSEYVATHQGGEGAYRRYGFTLVARFENRSGAPVYLNRCSPDSRTAVWGVELADGRSGDSGYDGVWACVGNVEPIVVRPGEARADTLLVLGPNSWNGLTLEPRGVMEGRFRLVYDASSCRGDRDCRLPREMRSSDVFRVRVER